MHVPRPEMLGLSSRGNIEWRQSLLMCRSITSSQVCPPLTHKEQTTLKLHRAALNDKPVAKHPWVSVLMSCDSQGLIQSFVSVQSKDDSFIPWPAEQISLGM